MSLVESNTPFAVVRDSRKISPKLLSKSAHFGIEVSVIVCALQNDRRTNLILAWRKSIHHLSAYSEDVYQKDIYILLPVILTLYSLSSKLVGRLTDSVQMTAASCREEACIIADTARIDRTVQ